jgi:hypothetical protein
MNLRLASVRDTNDPWENRPQEGGVANDPKALDNLRELIKELHETVSAAQIACFCGEDAGSQNDTSQTRGWARDRMWAQYADNHKGICLHLDREALIRNFRGALEADGHCLTGDVVYSDADDLPHLDADAMQRDRDQYVRDYRVKNATARYFRKRRDWVGEREFRLVHLPTRSVETPRYVPINGALVCITVGSRFPHVFEPALSKLCEDNRVPATRVRIGGIVSLQPYGPSALDGLAVPFLKSDL